MDRKTLLSPTRGLKSPTLGIAALVLMLIVGLSYREWRQYSRSNADAAETREIVAACDRVLSSVIDAETGQRGFLLTGETRYLEPYNRAVQTLPNEIAGLKRYLAARPGEAAAAAQLNTLVDQKLNELRQTIDLRRTEGATPALAVVLGDQGKRSMDAIRALCAQIQNHENSAQSQASVEGEAATETVLLITVAGSLVLLFLFAMGLEPFVGAGAGVQTGERSWVARYGAAILATIAATLLRIALTPFIGRTELAFSIVLLAVLFSAWFGGFRAGVVSVLFSALAADYYFAEPIGSLLIRKPADQISLLIFVVIGVGVALLADAQRRAVAWARRAENAERHERQRFETTLSSIGDAVIATDAKGRVTFANRIALSLVKWPEAEISGEPIDALFRILNEQTRATVESPVARVLRDGAIAGLANHTVLIARDGTEVPIDDSAAPIRGVDGEIQGTVLVFRDITERHRTEALSRLLSSIVESSEDAIVSEDLEGRVTSWNKGAEHMFGYPPEEIIGMPTSILSAPERPDEMPEILGRIKRGEHVNHYRTLRRTKAGNSIQVSLTVSPVHDASGRITGASRIVRDITVEVEAQREIAEQRERLQVTLSSIGDAVMATDTAGRVSYLNPVAERLTGWTAEDAAGRPLEEVFRIVNEHSRLPVDNPVATVLREGRVVGLANHTVLICRDGREIPIDDSAAPIRDQSGSIQGTVLVFRDNSERRRVERELRDSEERYHQAVEAAPNGMVVVNQDGEIVLLNSFTEELFGYSREEILGKRVEMLVPARFRASHQEYRQGFLSRPESRPMGAGRELYGLRKDGTEFPVEVGLNPIKTENQPLVLSSIVDITFRRRAEAASRLLASVVQSSVDGIISKDLDGVITSWNSGAERMFGYSAEEMTGRTISVLIPAGQVDEIPAVLERMKRGEPIEQYEAFRQTKNGDLITVSITWSPIHDAAGRILGVSKVVRDITERKRMEEQRLQLLSKEQALASERALREMEAELARVVRALSVGELATSIAHEINQPLAGVVTNAEAGLRWLSGETPNVQEARESLALVTRDGHRASAVIRRIREFLRKGEQVTGSLEINDVVQETVSLAQTELEKRQIVPRMELSSNLPRVRGDRIQLQQVILNLIMNGADAMASVEGTKALLVRSETADDGGVVVSVRDSGAGISPQDMPRMFDAFFTNKPSGIGMGLSISRSIIDAHAGRIWATLNEGPGLTVQFRLPAEESSYAASNPS
jgi:PAS domain S-box-containing protein